MLRQLILGLLALSVGAADLRVDHVTVAGRDLKALRAAFAAAGIRTEYGGKHTNGLSEMALTSFANGSYLELIAAQDPPKGAPGHYWQKFIDENAGPCAWAINERDLDAAAERLGIEIKESGRARPDGAQLKWRSASIGPEAQGTFFPFMIEDVTRRSLRANPSGRPTMPEYWGVLAVYVAVRDLDDAVKRYRQTFELGEPVRSFDNTLGGQTARFVGTPVVLITARKGWIAKRLEKFSDAPCAFVIGAAQNAQGPVDWLNIEGMHIGLIK